MENCEEIVLNIQKGQMDSFEQLYQKTYQTVYYNAFRMMNNEQEALDIVQDTYIAVYKSITSLKNPKSLNKWLISIVGNLCCNKFRDKNKREGDVSLDSDCVGKIIADPQQSPDYAIDKMSTGEIIEQMIYKLPYEQRLATIMYYYDDMTVGQIATSLECSIGTIKSRLSYARKNLKRQLRDEENRGNKLYMFFPFLLRKVFKQHVNKTLLGKDTVNNIFKRVISAGKANESEYVKNVMDIGINMMKSSAKLSALASASVTTAVSIGTTLLGTAVIVGITLQIYSLSNLQSEKYEIDNVNSIGSMATQKAESGNGVSARLIDSITENNSKWIKEQQNITVDGYTFTQDQLKKYSKLIYNQRYEFGEYRKNIYSEFYFNGVRLSSEYDDAGIGLSKVFFCDFNNDNVNELVCANETRGGITHITIWSYLGNEVVKYGEINAEQAYCSIEDDKHGKKYVYIAFNECCIIYYPDKTERVYNIGETAKSEFVPEWDMNSVKRVTVDHETGNLKRDYITFEQFEEISNNTQSEMEISSLASDSNLEQIDLMLRNASLDYEDLFFYITTYQELCSICNERSWAYSDGHSGAEGRKIRHNCFEKSRKYVNDILQYKSKHMSNAEKDKLYAQQREWEKQKDREMQDEYYAYMPDGNIGSYELEGLKYLKRCFDLMSTI